MVLALTTLLAAAPLGAQIDAGGLISSSWYVPQTRTRIDAALDNARISLRGEAVLDGEGLVLAMPVMGPWLLAGENGIGGGDRALLIATGLMQLAGLTVGILQLTGADTAGSAQAPVLSFSPIVGDQLGLSVKLGNF